ncbi:hypothetical protein [Arcicella rosea]|uniref:Uncharacterized protein n=1 Tax=Arcicella rosea TaxID=502909 RepID=A0A841EN62_9BACT|nr:hypothetical protein [Arcicella rosea]MBB6005132.1 hypothetical protein [Arcicella rosea]
MEATQTFLASHIVAFEKETMLLFKPSKAFYETVGINKKRFWQLVRGVKKPLTEETENLSKCLKVPLSQLMNVNDSKTFLSGRRSIESSTNENQ